ncbi:radical SAM protein, partial [bacterium SM23_31]
MLRYYSLKRHLHEVFGEPVVKICVDAGFTCPNRDGIKGYGGCIYCNDRGSGAPYINKKLSWEEQFEQGRRMLEKRNQASKCIIYFQAFSNTYAPVEYLEKLYKTALSKKSVAGLSIGTRPDCVSTEILDLIAELSKKTYLWLEYGAESIHERTLQLVNRRHTFQDFLDAYRAAKERGIRMCVH